MELRSPNSNNIYSDDVIGNINCEITINFNNGNMTINGKSIKDLLKSKDNKTQNEEEHNELDRMNKVNEDCVKEYDLSGCMIKKIDLSGQSSFFASFNESLVILKTIDCSKQSYVNISNIGFKDLDIDLSGLSEIILINVNTEDLNVDISGKSTIKLENVSGDDLSIDASGMSSVHGTKVNFKRIEKDTSGMASIKLN